MSLYNILFGRNAHADLLLAVIGFKQNDVERFRDVHVEGDGKTVAVYTRTGGGNRDDYPNTALEESPHYSHGEDDDFDSTYRTFYFNTPVEFVSDVVGLSDPLTNGLRAEFAQHLAATLNREPTEDDIETTAYQTEAAALSRLKHFKANGHTFVPLDDWAMESALKLAEANGGKLRSCWGIKPIAITITQNKVKWPGAKEPAERQKLTRAELGYDFGWRMDTEYWSHCQALFGEKYPLAMAQISESISPYLAKQAVSA